MIQHAETFYDERAREPVRQAIRTGASPNTGSQVKIKGQVSFYFAGAQLDYLEYLRQGVREHSLGYVSLRYKDMKKADLLTLDADGNFTDIKIKRGDRIVQLAKRSVEFFVTGFKDFAFQPKQGQTMIQVNFEDRHPSVQTGDL